MSHIYFRRFSTFSYDQTRSPEKQGWLATSIPSRLRNASVPNVGEWASIDSYDRMPRGDQRDCSLSYVIIILRSSYFRLGNPNLFTDGSTRCTASTVPIRNLLDQPPRCSWSSWPRWKLSQTIRPLRLDASNEQNDSTRFNVSLLKNESLVVLVMVIPRNEVTWDTVSFAPHP